MRGSELNDVNDVTKAGSGDFLDETIAFWQPRYPDRKLTREDARQMIHNVAGFFSLLQKWTDTEAATTKGETAISGDEVAPST